MNIEDAADNHIRRFADAAGHPGWDWTTQDIADAFIAGANWQKQHDAELIEIAYNDGITIGMTKQKEQMMKDIPKWYKVQRGSCFDKHTNFILSAREGHFYCSSIEVPRDGYILLVDELERLPKEDEK